MMLKYWSSMCDLITNICLVIFSTEMNKGRPGLTHMSSLGHQVINHKIQ